MKRLFAAFKINPDAEFLAQYRRLQMNMKYQQIKWVEENNIHITLKFFGETEERKIPEIGIILRQRASRTPAFDLNLSKLGVFGSSYAPKVIWCGIDPYEKLSELMKQIHEDQRKAGFEPDRQNPVPHLTLGRIRQLNDMILFEKALSQFRLMASTVMHMSEIILYESILRREGPLYVPLEKYSLGIAEGNLTPGQQ